MAVPQLDRRTLLVSTLGACLWAPRLAAQPTVTRPVVSEDACPLETIAPVAADGHRGLAVLRKPPGAGPFPAVVWFHGDIVTLPLERLENTVRNLANPTRLLAAGYVVVAPTYRSRDVDLQNPATIEDALAVVKYVQELTYVDSRSVVAAGCSGGGDLALETAARMSVCAVVAEEPASVLMTGVFNNSAPKAGERYQPTDGFFLLEDGRRYYTPDMQRQFRAKLAKIDCPILLVQGEVDRRETPINRFNADVLVPELRSAGKQLEIMVYPEQAHCFCSASGAPARPNGRVVPLSAPAAALKASQDIDAFCRRHVRTEPKPLDSNHVTHQAVR